MSDYIKRDDAIAEFVTNGSVFVYGVDECKAIISRLKLVPSADVRENVKGEWVQDEIAKKLNVYLCSNCNIPTQIVDSDGNTKLTRYCPNCGADMRGEA